MKQLGIKAQIISIALVPVFLIDLFFTYTQIDSGIEQASQLLNTRGQIIARQIASASELNLYTANDSQIKYVLDQSVGENDIVLASIYDREGALITQSLASGFDHANITEYLYFRQPILSQSINHSDVFTPVLDDRRETDILGWVHLYLSKQQLTRTTNQIILKSSGFFLSILFIAIIVTMIISRRVTQPIMRLMDHLKFVETGQLGKTIEPIESNEIGSVQKGFNRMTQALLANRQQLNKRIEQATSQLNKAVTELESKNRELGFSRDAAQNANETKSRFLANMSHEIRTPINGIKGFISLLNRSNLDPTQKRYVDIILKSTSDLTSIVNEILDFSKMESGKLQIVDEVFDLYEVVEQTRDILFINVLTKNIDLNLIIYSDTPRWVIGDKLRLKQILLNLIGNAIKFTDQGQVVIRVSLVDADDEQVKLLISVEDSGIGISEQDQANLFQAFSQVDSTDNRRFEGTGLGLVISKNLAGLMGGDIKMYSREGEGSNFELSLSFRVPDDDRLVKDIVASQSTALIIGSNQTCISETRCLFERAGVHTEMQLIDSRTAVDSTTEVIQRNLAYIDFLVIDLRHMEVRLKDVIDPDIGRSVRIIIVDYDQRFDYSQRYANSKFFSVINTTDMLRGVLYRTNSETAEIAAPVEKNTAHAKQVLVVDDNPINLKLASELIQLWGHQVCEADHGSKAMELYRNQKFDLIILDIQMPDIDGASLLNMMREHNPEDQTPVVALSANVLQDEADRLLEFGFDYFLSKPIDEDKFRSLLDGEPLRKIETLEEEPRELRDVSVDYIRSLALSADNPALLKQIFEILQRDIPDHQQQLQKAAGRNELEKLGAIAHKLNGVTCYASLPRLRHKLLDFQQRLARDKNLKVNEAVEELIAELAAVKQDVDHYLEQMTTE